MTSRRRARRKEWSGDSSAFGVAPRKEVSHNPLARRVKEAAPLRAVGREGFAGFAVFLLSWEAHEALEQVSGFLDRQWFDVLSVKLLDDEERWAIKGMLTTTRVPFAPAIALATLDVNPLRPTRWQQRRFPHLDNANLLMVQKSIVPNLGIDDLSQSLYTSVNSEEAWALAAAIMPERLSDLSEEIHRRLQANEHPFPVIQSMTGQGGHAKVELVRYEGDLAICKTFRLGKERFLERELFVRKELAETSKAIPGIIASGSNWLLTPYYHDVLKFDPEGLRLLPLGIAKEVVGVLAELFDAGYAYLDVRPENFLLDKAEGLKFIDFEYLYPYEHRPASFEGSYDVVGVPKGFKGDKPLAGARTYAAIMQHYVGLDLTSLLCDPPWKQYLKRTRYFWGYFIPKQLPRKLKASLLNFLNTRAGSAE